MQATSRLIIVVAIYAIATLANTAGATATFCPDDIGNNPTIEDNVTSNVGCQIGATDHDALGGNPDNHQVNVDMMFGFDDWIFAERAFDNDRDIDIGLTLVGDTISGLWSIDDIWDTLDITSLMLVLNDSGDADDNSSDDNSSDDNSSDDNSSDDNSSDDNSSDDSFGEPDNYVAYLITPDTTSGAYLTPFINAALGNPDDILYASAYFRTGDPRTTIPEPGSIALLGLGMIVLCRLSRRRTGR